MSLLPRCPDCPVCPCPVSDSLIVQICPSDLIICNGVESPRDPNNNCGCPCNASQDPDEPKCFDGSNPPCVCPPPSNGVIVCTTDLILCLGQLVPRNPSNNCGCPCYFVDPPPPPPPSPSPSRRGRPRACRTRARRPGAARPRRARR